MATVEYGPSGPTQVKDMDPTGTGLSDIAASFVAANASPFTNPRDMPMLAKVPDPRNTQNTKSTFIWAHFDISCVSVNGAGAQVVMSTPDPLAPVPIHWCEGAAGADAYTTWMNPNKIARRYEQAGISDMVYQQRELARRAKSYRVVGHGLKVWVSRNTTISRGNIEAGQFNFADCTNLTPSEPSARTNAERWSNAPGTSLGLGYHSMALQTSDILKFKQMLARAREQEIGFLAADEGATVRWTDSNDFKFQPSIDRGCVYPSYQGYYKSGYKKYETTNQVGTEPPSASSAMQFNPTFQSVAATPTEWNDINMLGSIKTYQSATQSYYAKPTAIVDGTTLHSYYGLGNDGAMLTFQSNNNDYNNYITDPDMQFNRGLYCDISGLDISQVLTVQVCWHIEYVPNGNESWDGQPSPVDTQYELIAAMLRERRAFPIVVKGHSFFSSIFKAVSKAAKFLFSTAAPVASTMLMAAPDPRVKALGVMVGAAGGAFNNLKSGLEQLREAKRAKLISGSLDD